ncbi:hypothetical protein KAR91_53485 [Candidatus Pacearchaeota archaeon]|nr:hypothetical protein [Candidatus Pacearchaeota archaeon]
MRVLHKTDIEKSNQLEQYQKDVILYRLKQYQQIESDLSGNLFYTVFFDGHESTIPLGFTAPGLADTAEIGGENEN